MYFSIKKGFPKVDGASTIFQAHDDSNEVNNFELKSIVQLTEIGKIGDHRLMFYQRTVGMQLVLTVKLLTEKKKQIISIPMYHK